MTTQSPDQSLSQSQGEEIDRIADKWAKLEIPSNKAYVPFMRDRYRAAITEAIESLSQSPAPSEEMEERINRIAREAGDWAERTYGKSGHLLHYITRQAARSALVALAAEREADVKMANDVALQMTMRLHAVADERDQLKRELAEAREQMDTFINQWSETNNSLQIENLALSLAYQRQKDALEYYATAPWVEHVGPWHKANYADRAEKALAETPDVSMWQPIESAPKDGTEILFLHSQPFAASGNITIGFWHEGRNDPNWVSTGIGGVLLESVWTHWQPLPPLPTLQPDHQK